VAVIVDGKERRVEALSSSVGAAGAVKGRGSDFDF
jgi:hypothetical protein